MPRLCTQLLPHIRTWAKERKSFPVMSWLDFVAKVREINNTADEEGVRNIAFYLNESVEVTEFFATATIYKNKCIRNVHSDMHVSETLNRKTKFAFVKDLGKLSKLSFIS